MDPLIYFPEYKTFDLTSSNEQDKFSKCTHNDLRCHHRRSDVLEGIYGKVNGNVNTKGSVRIAQQAIVEGNITGSDIRVGVIANGISNLMGKLF